MSRDALVVGVNTYQSLPSLKAPARDAEAIAQRLYTDGEFRVHRLPEVIQDGKPQIGQKTQVTLRELETALINLFKPKGSSIPQTAIFYFSGHGIQRDAGIQEGYLALSDSNPDQGFYGLSLFWLRRLLQESPVRQRIIWLDCCHSGEFLNFLEADPGAHPGTDRLFMAASREFETAYESLESQYSVFTEALLTGLDPHRLESGIVTNHALTDWVNYSLKGEIQQPLFESSGSEIILTRCNGQRTTSQPAISQSSKEICPYRGLEFFDESHAEYFFGREKLVGQLLQKLMHEHFVAVTGASGSGKSSLVRAGLIAQLRQGKKVPNSDQWKIKLITPTDHPLKSLAAAFIKPDLSDLERAEQLRRAETFLQDGGVGLAQLVRASLPETSRSTSLLPEHRPRFLLIIDQFEEVFTLSQGAQAERERQEFFDCLVGALDSVKDVLSVVIVLRSDFLGKCSFYEGLAQQIFQHQVTVSPLKYEQIKATIMQPAQKVGLVCEPNLVYTMMMDVIGAPGELPLLQYTLLELWRKRRVGIEGGVARLTLDAYQELGGVRGTLQKRATEVFQSLSPDEQGIAKRVFLSLTQLGEGTEDTRRRVAKSDLVSPAFSQVLVEQVLEKLVAAKLIIISQENASCDPLMQDTPDLSKASVGSASSELRTNAPTLVRTLQASCMAEMVDVAHEALIRNWSLLRGWLEESREVLRRQRRIEQAAQEWNQAGQPVSGDYLLHGLRLRDAEDFLKLHAPELSALAQQYISVSCAECLRTRRASRRLRLTIPSLLVATLTVVLAQYYGVVRTQTEQKDQLQQATARERAAIAQAVVQDTDADPMTALLISRLAVESDRTNTEAQASLRAALQNLRLQSEIQGHRGGVQQMVFSPDHQYLATVGTEGTIRLWAMKPKTIYNTALQAEKTLVWSETGQATQDQTRIQSIAFSPDGQTLAATEQQSSSIKLWSVASGKVLRQLVGASVAKQVRFSPNGEWIVGLEDDRTISVWQAATGELKAKLLSNKVINSLEFSPDGQFVLTAGEDGTVQMWQIQSSLDGTTGLKSVKTLNHPDGVVQAKFSAHGRWIATLCEDGKVRLWDSQTGQLQRQLTISSPTKPANSLKGQLASAVQVEADQLDDFPSMKQMVFAEDEHLIATLDANQQVWIWNTESGQLQTKLENRTLKSHEERQMSVGSPDLLQFSPNNQIVVTTDSQPNSRNGFYTAYLWNSVTGQQVGRLPGHREPITGVQFSPDGTYIVTASMDGTVRLWNATLGGELPSVQLKDASTSLTFLPSQVLYSKATSSEILADTTHKVFSSSINAIDSKGRTSNFQGADSLTLLDRVVKTKWQNWFNWQMAPSEAWGAENSAQDNSAKTQVNSTNLTATSELTNVVSNMMLISADGQIQRWQILTNSTSLSDLRGVSGAHVAALQSPDSASTWSDKLLALTQSQFGQIGRAATQPAMLGFDRLSYLFHPANSTTAAMMHWQDRLKLNQTDAAPSSVVASPDGRWLAAAHVDGQVVVYQIQPDQSLQLAYRLQNWRLSTEQSPVSQILDATLPLASAATGATQQQVGEPTAIRRLIFSPDNHQLLGIADDLTMRSWQTQTGQLQQVFQGHGATIHQAKYSPDGQWIISASWDKTARIWQADTGRMITVLPHQDAVSSVAFSSDGHRVVTANWNGTAQVWQVSTGKALFQLEGHQKAILDVEFSPDGQQLVTASSDGTARLWNATTGEEQTTLTVSSANEELRAIEQAFFSPDGQYVVTLTQDGQVNFWAATQEMLLKIASERSVRQLTPQECRRYLKLANDQCAQLSN